MEEKKIDPAVYLKALEIFLDRLLVKKIIPIPYGDAVDQVILDMESMFPDEENRKAFRGMVDNFKAQTDLEGWYEEH